MSSFELTLPIPSVVSVRNTKLGRSVSVGGRNWSGLTNLSEKLKSRRGYGLCCKAELSELAPDVSAAYGALLLGGGLFAYSKSGSKGSLFGGLTGSVLMSSAYFLTKSPETSPRGYHRSRLCLPLLLRLRISFGIFPETGPSRPTTTFHRHVVLLCNGVYARQFTCYIRP